MAAKWDPDYLDEELEKNGYADFAAMDSLEEWEEVKQSELDNLARQQAISWGIDKVLADTYGCEWVR